MPTMPQQASNPTSSSSSSTTNPTPANNYAPQGYAYSSAPAMIDRPPVMMSYANPMMMTGEQPQPSYSSAYGPPQPQQQHAYYPGTTPYAAHQQFPVSAENRFFMRQKRFVHPIGRLFRWCLKMYETRFPRNSRIICTTMLGIGFGKGGFFLKKGAFIKIRNRLDLPHCFFFEEGASVGFFWRKKSLLGKPSQECGNFSDKGEGFF